STRELARLVLVDLSLPCLARRQVVLNISLLRRMGYEKEAKEAFLNSRSATIKHRTRQLKLEGDTQVYIRELSVVYFRLIRATCDWYSEFFKDASMSSGLIMWVQQEMADYAIIFRRQVFHDLQRFEVIANCISHAFTEVEILGHAGLDLKFMLDQEFFQDLTQSIHRYGQRCLHTLDKVVTDDDFAVVGRVPVDQRSKLVETFGDHLPLVSSTVRLSDLLCSFGEEISYIVRDSLYGQSVVSISSIIENILKNFLNALRRRNLQVPQELALLTNTQCVISWAIPRGAQQLDQVFKRTVTDIHNLEHRLEGFPATLQEVFCQKHAQRLTGTVYSTLLIDTSLDAPVNDDTTPSEGLQDLLRELGHLGRELDKWPLRKRVILGGIIDHLFFVLIDEKSWERDGKKLEFGYRGVHQLVLDIHFLLRVCGSLVSKSTNALANKVCERALRSYFNGPLKRDDAMKDREWYDNRVYAMMEVLGYEFPDFGRGFEHRAQGIPSSHRQQQQQQQQQQQPHSSQDQQSPP
ncbi:exocyst complex component exo84, partial [Spiromyces aspiralis]